MTHYEERLERDLAKLGKRVKRMGGAVVGAVRSATKSALTRDEELATQTILGDLPINRQARELDHRCHIFIARHLPSAGHLRHVSSAMRLVATLLWTIFSENLPQLTQCSGGPARKFS